MVSRKAYQNILQAEPWGKLVLQPQHGQEQEGEATESGNVKPEEKSSSVQTLWTPDNHHITSSFQTTPASHPYDL